MNKIQEIQAILGVDTDGKWGSISQSALNRLVDSGNNVHSVMASSFADDADVAGFNAAKARGMSDQEAFAHGDNGIGYWGDNTNTDLHPMCALPPDDMISEFGTVNAARHKPVNVTIGGKTVTCILADRMPWKKNITNGAGIDLAPAAQKAFDLHPPFLVKATWEWA